MDDVDDESVRGRPQCEGSGGDEQGDDVEEEWQVALHCNTNRHTVECRTICAFARNIHSFEIIKLCVKP